MALAALIHYSVTRLELPFTRSDTSRKVSTPPFCPGSWEKAEWQVKTRKKSYFTCCQVLWDHFRGDLALRCDWYAKMWGKIHWAKKLGRTVKKEKCSSMLQKYNWRRHLTDILREKSGRKAKSHYGRSLWLGVRIDMTFVSGHWGNGWI